MYGNPPRMYWFTEEPRKLEQNLCNSDTAPFLAKMSQESIGMFPGSLPETRIFSDWGTFATIIKSCIRGKAPSIREMTIAELLHCDILSDVDSPIHK